MRHGIHLDGLRSERSSAGDGGFYIQQCGFVEYWTPERDRMVARTDDRANHYFCQHCREFPGNAAK
jgi:hypothetical protein